MEQDGKMPGYFGSSQQRQTTNSLPFGTLPLSVEANKPARACILRRPKRKATKCSSSIPTSTRHKFLWPWPNNPSLVPRGGERVMRIQLENAVPDWLHRERAIASCQIKFQNENQSITAPRVRTIVLRVALTHRENNPIIRRSRAVFHSEDHRQIDEQVLQVGRL